MPALLLSLAGILIGLALLWGTLLWLVRYRPKAARKPWIRSAVTPEPMSVSDLVESWRTSKAP